MSHGSHKRRGGSGLADMSLPAEARSRRKPKRHKARRQKAARAGKQAREGERKMERSR